MPFDDPSARVEIAVANREEIAILDGMARRLATPHSWCKNSLYTGSSRCLLGALNEEDHGDPGWTSLSRRGGGFRLRASANVRSRLNDLVGYQLGYVFDDWAAVFNNAATTTHADVLGLIQRARASFE